MMNAQTRHSNNPSRYFNGLNDALRPFTTAAMVVTTCGDGGAPLGLAVNSFASASHDPPLMLCHLNRDAALQQAAAAVIQRKTKARLPGDARAIYPGRVHDLHRTDKAAPRLFTGRFAIMRDRF
jgi:hypothetical protein